MISFAGSVGGALDASYIYVIIGKECVYVGETGSLPIIRWGQHMQRGGTLQTKLLKTDLIKSISTDEWLFLGIRCHVVDREAAPYKKIARRAIEEELQRQFNLDSMALGFEFDLLSEAPPAPVRFNWTFDPKDVAKRAFTLVIDEYQRWSKHGSVSMGFLSV